MEPCWIGHVVQVGNIESIPPTSLQLTILEQRDEGLGNKMEWRDEVKCTPFHLPTNRWPTL